MKDRQTDGRPLLVVSREGFSLVEVVVTMVLVAVIVMSLGALTTITAQRSIQLANSAGRQAFALQETNRMSAIPYDSIPGKVGCDTLTTGNLRYRRCTAMTQGFRYREVKVIVTPLRTGSFADTVTFRRVTEALPNPLFTQ
ncbi:MAG: prepilin-type N-terminal cleavage/methylation domain-containing protein [Longimicrobiales bacterium]